MCSRCDGALPRENVVTETYDVGGAVTYLHCPFCDVIVEAYWDGPDSTPTLVDHQTFPKPAKGVDFAFIRAKKRMELARNRVAKRAELLRRRLAETQAEVTAA